MSSHLRRAASPTAGSVMGQRRDPSSANDPRGTPFSYGRSGRALTINFDDQLTTTGETEADSLERRSSSKASPITGWASWTLQTALRSPVPPKSKMSGRCPDSGPSAHRAGTAGADNRWVCEGALHEDRAMTHIASDAYSSRLPTLACSWAATQAVPVFDPYDVSMSLIVYRCMRPQNRYLSTRLRSTRWSSIHPQIARTHRESCQPYSDRSN